MHTNQKGILLCRIVVRWVEQPSLNFEPIVSPFDVLCLPPRRLQAVIQVCDLFQVVKCAGPDLRGSLIRTPNQRDGVFVGEGYAHLQVPCVNGFREGHTGLRNVDARCKIEGCEMTAAANLLCKSDDLWTGPAKERN